MKTKRNVALPFVLLLLTCSANADEQSTRETFTAAFAILQNPDISQIVEASKRKEAARLIQSYCEALSGYMSSLTPDEKQWLVSERSEIDRQFRERNVQAGFDRQMTFMKNPLYARDRLKEGLSSCALAAKAIQSFIPTDLKTEMYRWAVLETILMDNGTWEAAYFERVRAQLRIRSLPLSDEEFAAYHLMMAKAIGLAIVLPHLQAISSSK